MRRVMAILLAGALCLSLAGCGRNIPAQAADGAKWDDSWVNVGGILGVDTPEGLDPRENNDTLGPQGMYYAAWSAGDAERYTNDDGKEVDLYSAQVYLLLAGYDAPEKAQDTVAEWLSLASERYDIRDTAEGTYNGQAFTVITYTYHSETNPYARGASAFGVYRNYAVSAELSCREAFGGDAGTILADFLEHCHYAA